MNAFDFVVTVALGSTLATIVLNKNIPLAEGVIAIFLFIGLQYILTWLSVRIKAFKTLITSKPSLVFYKGNFLYENMKKERISTEGIKSAARQKGISSLEEIDIVILETTGDITIIEKISNNKKTTYDDVKLSYKD